MLARFDTWDAQAQSLVLHGPAGRLRVTSPHPGVLRLCLDTPAQRGEKVSWALETPVSPHPLQVEKTARGVRAATNGARCEISLDPFGWVFTGVGGERIETTACWIGEERRWTEVPHPRPLLDIGEEGSPVLTAELDGRLIGHGVTLVLASPRERHYYGLGERTGGLDRRGRRHTTWASDPSFILPSTDALYQAIPFLLQMESGRASGVLVDESWRSVFDLAATDPDRVEVRVDGPTLDLYLVAGPTPREVLERYTALVGRTPLPPLWALGYHQSRYSYRSESEVRDLVRTFRARNLPLDVVHLDIDYMDGYRVFTWDAARFPDPARLARDLREEGVRLIVISEPSLKPDAGYRPYEGAAARGFLVRTERGDVFQGEVWTTPAVFVDFLQPEARTWWGSLFQPLVEMGVSGFWDDMNEPSVRGTPGRTLPLDARHGTQLHLEVHNVYGLFHARATWEGLRSLCPEERPVVISRSGYAGIQRYAAVWTGDNSSWWEHLEGSIPMLLNLGLSGVPFIGADIGGFHGNAEAELLVRWTQVGAFYTLMRNHSVRGSRRQEPWAFGEDAEALIRSALELRYRLLPYLYTLMEEAAASGLPPMRPLFLHYPQDFETYQVSDQFLWGADLLVAPIARPGVRHRAVYFPEGRWADWWTGTTFAGPGWAVVDAPLDRIPLFLRAGAAVPTTQPRPHTPDRAVWEDLEWRIHPSFPASGESPAASGRLYEDDGRTVPERLRERRVSWLSANGDSGSRLRVSVAVEGTLAGERRSLRLRCYGPSAAWRVAEPSGARVERVEGTDILIVTLPPRSSAVILER